MPWLKACEVVQAQLDTDHRIYVFKSMEGGLFQTLLSLQSLYDFKREFYYSFGLGALWPPLHSALMKKGMVARWMDGSINEVDAKKTLFQCYETHDAITAEKNSDGLTAPGSEKVLSLVVAHHQSVVKEKLKDLQKNEAVLFSDSSKKLVCLAMGAKWHPIRPTYVGSEEWVGFKGGSWKDTVEDSSWVQAIESKPSTEVAALKLSTDRIYDRALVSFPGQDGSFLRDQLIKKGIEPHLVEALSLGRWSQPLLFDQAKQQKGWGMDPVRGLLVLSSELSQRPSFEKDLKDVIL